MAAMEIPAFVRTRRHSSGATEVQLAGKGLPRPGVDRFKVVKDGQARPWGSVGTFVGRLRADVVLDFEGEALYFPSDAVKEAERLESDLDPQEFDLGYGQGAEASARGGRAARAYSRDAEALGFLKGCIDASAGNLRPFDLGPYNEVVRALEELEAAGG